MNSSFLFYSERFINQQGEALVLSSESNEGKAELALFIHRGQAWSPLRAPFGSFGFYGNPTPALVEDILLQIEQVALKNRLSTFTLVMPPDCYQPEIHLWLQPMLLARGYHIAWQDLNFHMDLTQSFIGGLHRSERWKLNKLRREGFRFREIEMPDWDFAYPFFLESRRRKGYDLSMNREELETAFKRFPDRFRMWGVYLGTDCAAMAITIRVSGEIEYIFYTADDLRFRRLSPVVMLHYGLWQAGQEKAMSLLDLGTSSLKGVVNNGVATFKRNLGATASLKTTMVKKFLV